MSAPLLLLDGASMWFRSFFGVPSSITSPDGRPVNAVRGFLDSVATVITRHKPGRLVVCLDLDWRPQFRVDRIPSYKAHRVEEENPSGQTDVEEVPDDLSPQVEMITEILDAFGICTGGAEGYEADDVIGTLAAKERRDPVIVVSGDRDLLQVVRDAPVAIGVLYLGRGLSNATLLGPVEVAERYGVPADRPGEGYAELALLRGDPSDGLPGVAGVGEKTAASVISQFGSWAELLDSVTDRTDTRLTAGVRTKLAASSDYLSVVEQVVRVATDAQVVLDRDDVLPAEPVDPGKLDELTERWGLGGSIERLRTALRTNAAA